MERPLLLHSSALSEPEYLGYTCILNELAPDAGQDWKSGPRRGRTAVDVNSKQVPLGETRGWLRGKYALDPSLIDEVAAYFKPNLPRPDTLDAAQFFAFLRLLSHGANGQGIDRALVFVQAPNPLGYPGTPQKSPNLTSNKQAAAPPMPPRSLPQSRSRTPIDRSPERFLPPIPPPKGDYPTKPPSSHSSPAPLGSNPFRRSITTQHPSTTSSTSSFQNLPQPSTPPRSVTTNDNSNTLWTNDIQYISDNQPVKSKSAGMEPSEGSAYSWRKQSADDITPLSFPSTNPFLSRSKSTTSAHHHHHTPNVVDLNPISPPLPPRKPVLSGTKPSMQPPPRHPAPPPPPKPSASIKPSSQSASTGHSHPSTGSTLIRQSLIAAKTAQKASEHSLEKIKTWEIIKSSSTGGSIKSRHAAANPKDPTSGDDQSARPGASPPSSSSSLEHVAAAKVPSAPASILGGYTASSRLPGIPGKPPRPDLLFRSTSPVKIQSTAVLSDPTNFSTSLPPVGPDSPLGSPALSTTSTNSPPITASRTTRSKSLHDPSSNRPPVPPLPPTRKRPESIQVLTSPFAATANNSASSNSSGLPSTSVNSTPLSRRTSLRKSPGHGYSQSLSSTATTASSTAAESINSLYSSFKNNTRALLHQNEFEKLVGKAEGGLVPGRGYLKSRGMEGERLVDTRDAPDTDLIDQIDDENEDVEVKKERDRLNALRLDKGPPLKPVSNTTTTTSVLDSDSDLDDDGGASAGMDSGEWEGWDRTGPRAGSRGSSTWNDANAQRRAVQAELDELKGVRTNPLMGDGWSRLK